MSVWLSIPTWGANGLGTQTIRRLRLHGRLKDLRLSAATLPHHVQRVQSTRGIRPPIIRRKTKKWSDQNWCIPTSLIRLCHNPSTDSNIYTRSPAKSQSLKPTTSRAQKVVNRNHVKPHGLTIRRLTSDNGGECTANYYRSHCKDLAILQASKAPRTNTIGDREGPTERTQTPKICVKWNGHYSNV